MLEALPAPPDPPMHPSTPTPICWSSRLVNKDPTRPSVLEQAINESKESAARIKLAKEDRKRALQELQENGPPLNEGVNLEDLRTAFESLSLNSPNADANLLHTILNAAANDLDTAFNDDPSWAECMDSTEQAEWIEAARDELQSLKDMEVFKLIPQSALKKDQKVRKGKLVCHNKCDELGKIFRCKVWYVFKGFEQIFGKDYNKATSPTARMESWRVLLHLAASWGWDAQQIDIKTAFLYGLLPDDEVQYMEQPARFEEPGKEDWVMMLQRGLYGMKQAGQIWNQTMHRQMLQWGFLRLSAESCIYYCKSPTGTIIAAVHVDDFLSIASKQAENEAFKQQMQQVWKISDLDTVRHLVGITVEWDQPNKTVMLSQTSLINKIVG